MHIYDSNNLNNALKIHKELQVIEKNAGGGATVIDRAVNEIANLGQKFSGHRFTRLERFVFFVRTGTSLSNDFNKVDKFQGEIDKLQKARETIFTGKVAQTVKKDFSQLEQEFRSSERSPESMEALSSEDAARLLENSFKNDGDRVFVADRTALLDHFKEKKSPEEFKGLLTYLRNIIITDGKVTESLIPDETMKKAIGDRLNERDVNELLAITPESVLNEAEKKAE